MSHYKIIASSIFIIALFAILFIGKSNQTTTPPCDISSGYISNALLNINKCTLGDSISAEKESATSTVISIKDTKSTYTFNISSIENSLPVSLSPSYANFISSASGTDTLSNEITASLYRIYPNEIKKIGEFTESTYNENPADIEPYKTITKIIRWDGDQNYIIQKTNTTWWEGISKDPKTETIEKTHTVNPVD